MTNRRVENVTRAPIHDEPTHNDTPVTPERHTPSGEVRLEDRSITSETPERGRVQVERLYRHLGPVSLQGAAVLGQSGVGVCKQNGLIGAAQR